MTIWCNNSQCGWNSRINDEPGDGEECRKCEPELCIASGSDRVLVCQSYTSPPTKAEAEAP